MKRYYLYLTVPLDTLTCVSVSSGISSFWCSNFFKFGSGTLFNMAPVFFWNLHVSLGAILAFWHIKIFQVYVTLFLLQIRDQPFLQGFLVSLSEERNLETSIWIEVMPNAVGVYFEVFQYKVLGYHRHTHQVIRIHTCTYTHTFSWHFHCTWLSRGGDNQQYRDTDSTNIYWTSTMNRYQ